MAANKPVSSNRTNQPTGWTRSFISIILLLIVPLSITVFLVSSHPSTAKPTGAIAAISDSKCKQGLNSSSLQLPCNQPKFYHQVNYSCYDQVSGNYQTPRCTTATELNHIAYQICRNYSESACQNIPSPPPILTPTIIPTEPINWQTDQAQLRAEQFYLKIDDRIYTTAGSTVNLKSNPPTATHPTITLEADWVELGTKMKLKVAFKSNGQTWQVKEFETYDGNTPGNWLSYPVYLQADLGHPLTNNGSLLLSSNYSPGKPIGTLFFSNYSLQPHFPIR